MCREHWLVTFIASELQKPEKVNETTDMNVCVVVT